MTYLESELNFILSVVSIIVTTLNENFGLTNLWFPGGMDSSWFGG